MAELPKLELPELPIVGGVSPLGVVFPPTWIVIHNGHPTDKEAAEAIAAYLQTKMPPVIAMVREVLPDADPDPMDLMAHGVIIVGGPMCWWPSESKWHWEYMKNMDPGWVNKGTAESPIFMIVQKEPEAYETTDNLTAMITSIMGAFPWLSVFNVTGYTAEGTVQAGELFCEGKLRGIWINKQPVAGTPE